MIDFSVTYNYIVALVLSGILGLCIGSFLNVVIYRVPNNMSLAKPASHCPKCNYMLKWYDNIPVVSYIILGGKCRKCKEHIAFRYTIVEVLTMLLWLLTTVLFIKQSLVLALLGYVIVSTLVCIVFIDLENMIIPDRFQIILAAAAVVWAFFDNSVTIWSRIIGFAAALVLTLGLIFVFKKLAGREALGGGDVKMAATAGFLLGWQAFILMMLIASILGSIFMLYEKRKNGESREIPFGPYLSIGLLVALYFGQAILNWYINLFVF